MDQKIGACFSALLYTLGVIITFFFGLGEAINLTPGGNFFSSVAFGFLFTPTWVFVGRIGPKKIACLAGIIDPYQETSTPRGHWRALLLGDIIKLIGFQLPHFIEDIEINHCIILM